MIGLFLALLELARQRKVVFHQVDVGEIVLELNQDGDEAALAESDAESDPGSHEESAASDGSDEPVDPSA